MQLSDLTEYAEEKYHIEEEHKWPDFPGFSVLCSPDTGRWVALLMRQWDSISGGMIEVCDIKYDRELAQTMQLPFITEPFRMHGKKWVGVIMEENTREKVVFSMLDFAIHVEAVSSRQGVAEPSRRRYSDTPLSSAGSYQSPRAHIPKKILDMIHLYEFSDTSFSGKCKNFYRQGKFMEDFEDDAPHDIQFKHYYTTYHDLNITQLRAYFTWRTQVRKGKYEPISLSLAYMHLYELICGIGCKSPLEAFEKLKEFEKKFLDAGYGDTRMRGNLRRWMFDFAVLNGLDTAAARKCMHPVELKWDDTFSNLKEPQMHTDEEIFKALSLLYSNVKRKWESPVITGDRKRGMHLFALAWRLACKDSSEDFFESFFYGREEHEYRPFSNAVYFSPRRHADTVYHFSACREYICKNGRWRVRAYDISGFRIYRLEAFMHETDLVLRRHLKTGHFLRKKDSEQWAECYALKAIEEEERERQEALRPKITIHFSGLDKIREDAAVTRDSLLTEEEMEEPEAEAEKVPEPVSHGDQLHAVLCRLLSGGDVTAYIKQNHLIPSVITDEINEALFDEIGDSVLSCDGDRIQIVEDYREDLQDIIGDKKWQK